MFAGAPPVSKDIREIAIIFSLKDFSIVSIALR
jgi:hypothetical protein